MQTRSTGTTCWATHPRQLSSKSRKCFASKSNMSKIIQFRATFHTYTLTWLNSRLIKAKCAQMAPFRSVAEAFWCPPSSRTRRCARTTSAATRSGCRDFNNRRMQRKTTTIWTWTGEMAVLLAWGSHLSAKCILSTAVVVPRRTLIRRRSAWPNYTAQVLIISRPQCTYSTWTIARAFSRTYDRSHRHRVATQNKIERSSILNNIFTFNKTYKN